MADAHDCSSSGLDKGPNGVGQVTHFLTATWSLLIGSFRSFRNLFSRFRNQELQNDATTSSTGEHTYYSTAPQELWTEPLSKDLQDATTSSTGEHTQYWTAPQELWTEPLSKDLQDATTSSTGEHTYYSTAPQELWNEPLSKGLQDATTSSTGEHTYYSTAPQELWTELLSKNLQDLDFDLHTKFRSWRSEQDLNFLADSENNEGESRTELLSNVLQDLGFDHDTKSRPRRSEQDLNFLVDTESKEGVSSCEEVQGLHQSDLCLLQWIAEGGQAHVYFAECKKFSTPVVVKRLKYGNVDLCKLLCRMEKLMKIRKENNSAICRVFGAGVDFVGNVWVVMERMAGDLRTLINRRMSYLEEGQMPFDYNNTITMMMHIAQGMEDLHRCGLIHADLKASNILVTPVIMDPKGEEVDGSQQASESMYFYVKIGDFETSDGVVGTRFWRAPEVLQALTDGAKPILSPASDVYSYGMLCYELLTGRIPFERCGCSNKAQILKILTGQRPELPAHVNLTMKKLLHACWHTKPRKRPGWTSIIKTLKKQLKLHPPDLQQPKRRAQPQIEMEREEMEAAAIQPQIGMEREEMEAAAMTSEISNFVVTSWEEVVAQGLGTDAYDTWKKKVVPEILPEILPIVKVILERRKALTQDAYDIFMLQARLDFYPVMGAFNKAWDQVKKAWTEHVGRNFRPGELGIDHIFLTSETEKKWANEAVKPYNLLGPTAEHWLKKILATAKEWQTFQQILSARCHGNENIYQRWEEKLRRALFAWDKVCIAFHAWHVKSPISVIAWQAVEKKSRKWREDMKIKFILNIMVAKIYLEVHNGPKLEAAMGSIETWQAFELEKVTIRRLFLENTIQVD